MTVKYAVFTETKEHYNAKTNEYATVDELLEMIAKGKKPSYVSSHLSQHVDTLEDAKVIRRAKELEDERYNTRDRIVTRKLVKIEEVAND